MPTEPDTTQDAPPELLLAYLDHYRAVVLAKLDGLTEEELRRSRVPSGWSPLELLWHLANVERRWLVWRFAGDDVPDPWLDRGGPAGRPEDPWRVPDGMTPDEVVARFRAQTERSRQIVAGAALADRARAGDPIGPEGQRPTLGWILFHLLQEYARHAGHLDIVRELADGTTGE
jgi:uncharacterized damage-inducible protein DinB